MITICKMQALYTLLFLAILANAQTDPYIYGSVNSSEEFNELVLSYNKTLSVITFNVYRRDYGWDCCTTTVPIINDTRVSGTELYGCAVANFTTTIYSFSDFQIRCPGAFMIEYSLLVNEVKNEKNSMGSVNYPISKLLAVLVLGVLTIL